ncbi:hypothetical protein F5Y16DRAFT_417855 [Xylariaceae sp. FL0255]|nr:hypothetical protein F5Y16DRAFT_417855 [Xylariaceae sp. FL0255]
MIFQISNEWAWRSCANCSKPLSTWQCDACSPSESKSIPEYTPGDVGITYYCSLDCLEIDRLQHEPHCELRRKRQRLYRAAEVFQFVLLAYRECIFDMDITRIDYRDGELRLHRLRPSASPRLPFGPFPPLMDSVILRMATLASGQCGTMLALLGRLSEFLLSGTASSTEIVNLVIRRPNFRTRLVTGPLFPAFSAVSEKYFHTVLKVRLRNHDNSITEDWILDPAGCQYGFTEVMMPYEKYLRTRDASLACTPSMYHSPDHLCHWTEATDLAYRQFLLCYGNANPNQGNVRANTTRRRSVEKMLIERNIRAHYATFIHERFFTRDVLANVTEKAALLVGTDEKCMRERHRLTDHLIWHMRQFFEATVESYVNNGDDVSSLESGEIHEEPAFDGLYGNMLESLPKCGNEAVNGD